jgi:hypothetical protein
MIVINNLDARTKALMQVVWEMDNMDKVTAFMNTLSLKDASAIKHLIDIAKLGGDEVQDLGQAKKELDRIMKL